MKIYLYILKFLFIGALFIVSNNNLHLNNPAEREVFYANFHSWLNNILSSVTQITGYVTSSEWLPNPNPSPQGNPLANLLSPGE